MSKAILILNDMPDSCIDCRFCREIDEGVDACCEIMNEPNNKELCRMIDVSYPQDKPNWCPLKELPQKKETNDNAFMEIMNIGYNACIDDILKGSE